MRAQPTSCTSRKRPMKKTGTYWPIQLAMLVLPALSILNLQEALADSEPGKIVVVDLLTVKEPKSEAESRLRVKRTDGDYLEFGLPVWHGPLRRVIKISDPSMRADSANETMPKRVNGPGVPLMVWLSRYRRLCSTQRTNVRAECGSVRRFGLTGRSTANAD